MYQDTLRTIYFSYFHSVLSSGIIFCCNSAYSSNIFKIQKRIIRIIINARNRDSCHQLFKNLKILPPKSQFFPLPFYFGIKIFIHLPTSIKNTSHDTNQFRSVLKSLLVNSFYLEEYFAWNYKIHLGSV